MLSRSSPTEDCSKFSGLKEHLRGGWGLWGFSCEMHPAKLLPLVLNAPSAWQVQAVKQLLRSKIRTAYPEVLS